MARRFTSITGFVLAGGASRRMGRPKALLLLGGQTMLERQVNLLRAVVQEVFVVGWPAKCRLSGPPATLRDLPRWPDDLPNRGPLGGIFTGLNKSKTEYNLFVSCDLPFVKAEFLRYLCRRARRARAEVTVPESAEHRMNPVCAVYRRRALPAIGASLALGENKITRFFPRVRSETIPWREIARAGFAPAIFDNMNTPEQYQTAKRMMNDEC